MYNPLEVVSRNRDPQLQVAKSWNQTFLNFDVRTLIFIPNHSDLPANGKDWKQLPYFEG